MELKSNHSSPVLTDPAPVNKSRLGIPSGLLPYSQQGPSFSASGKYISIPRKKPAKLDDVRSNGWLDAMKSSSPPRKKLIKDFSLEVTAAADDSESPYCSWMLKYPSALYCFGQIVKHASNKKIAIFLDYDGTLSPIVDDPDRALMSDATRSAVRNLALYFPTAIISGRSRDKVFELVGLTELYYAGSHGMDIMGPINSNTVSDDHPNCVKSTDQQGKELKLFQPAREFLPMIDEVFRTLVENTKGIEGAKVENHKFCASVHYRNVDEKNWSTVAQCLRPRDALTEDPGTFSREQSADVKLVHLDSESAASASPAVMKCLLPPHKPVAFASFEEYDVHYQKTHMNRCSECQKNFPDEYILHLHIAENHDPFNAARRERGEQTYACLVSTCERLCSTAPKRRMHCIDKHQFPKNYDFFIINDGIDRRNSMLRQTHRRRSSTMNSIPSDPRAQSSAGAAAEAMDVVQPDEPEQVNSQQQREPRSSHIKLRGRGGFSHPQGRGHQAVQNSATLNADPVDKLASSMSALHFIPHSVRMTRSTGRGRGG